MRHSDISFHLRAETNDTVIFGNEHSARAIALRGRSCLPTDETDKTVKLNVKIVLATIGARTDRNVDGAVVHEMTSG